MFGIKVTVNVYDGLYLYNDFKEFYPVYDIHACNEDEADELAFAEMAAAHLPEPYVRYTLHQIGRMKVKR